MTGWRTDFENMPEAGCRVLVYRPLAENSNDEPIAIMRVVFGGRHCWEKTVPPGAAPFNPTDGACHVTHWMPIPEPPQ